MSARTRAVAMGGEQGGASIERRMSYLDGRPVIEVDIRARPRWLWCDTASHAIEVAVLRPESRYRRLVFTISEWNAFLVDVKAGLYDEVEAA